MVRKAKEQDLAELAAFRCTVTGGSRRQAEQWLSGVIGLENILLVTADEKPVSMLCAVPVTLGQRHGALFCGMATLPEWRGRGLMTKLLSGCLQAFAATGSDFVVAVPGSAKAAAKLAEQGFQNAFPMRIVRHDIASNLWAQAEFDNMTVRRMLETRARYQPLCVELPEENMIHVFEELYHRGITLVSNQRGYGIYYEKGDTLQFLELQADNDHSADVLLEAARQKTGATHAMMMLGGSQPLYLGEGRRCGYGMIRFLGQPFDVSGAYLRLFLGD
ncbi:MAG: GNAT family N-acetyltransferase [Gemmiger sp.]